MSYAEVAVAVGAAASAAGAYYGSSCVQFVDALREGHDPLLKSAVGTLPSG